MKEEPLNFLSILQKKEKDRIFHFLQIDGLFAHDENAKLCDFNTHNPSSHPSGFYWGCQCSRGLAITSSMGALNMKAATGRNQA